MPVRVSSQEGMPVRVSSQELQHGRSNVVLSVTNYIIIF